MRGKHVEERQPDVAGEREVGIGVAAEVVVEEDAAGAARLVAVRQEEVAVAPGLELGIVARVVAVAGSPERGVEVGRVLHRLGRVEPHRRQIAAAAEPALGGDQHPRVEMRRRHARAAHMRDQADAARPEARIRLGARDLRAELRAELAPDGGDVHADLLEHPPAHHAHHAAAAARPRPVGADEPAGRPVRGTARPRSPRTRRTAGRAGSRTTPARLASALVVAAGTVSADCDMGACSQAQSVG